MKSKFYANVELQDEKVIEALVEAKEMYENGEIVETRDLLAEIVKAIELFEKNYEAEEKAFPEAKKMVEIAEKSKDPTRGLIKKKMSESILEAIKKASEEGDRFVYWGYGFWCVDGDDLADIDPGLEQEVFDEIIDELQEKGYFIDAHLGAMKICW